MDHEYDEQVRALKLEREDLSGLLQNAIDVVNEHAPKDWMGPLMPGDAPATFIVWQARELAQAEADRAQAVAACKKARYWIETHIKQLGDLRDSADELHEALTVAIDQVERD